MSTPGTRPLYDPAGQVVARIGNACERWEGRLVAQCDAGHRYVLHSLTDECPICEGPAGGGLEDAPETG